MSNICSCLILRWIIWERGLLFFSEPAKELAISHVLGTQQVCMSWNSISPENIYLMH